MEVALFEESVATELAGEHSYVVNITPFIIAARASLFNVGRDE